MREVCQTSDDVNDTTNLIKEGEKFSTVIQRNGNFGFSIAGGNQTVTNGNENFYISKINQQEKKSSLAIGDRLLAINGHDTGNVTHDQAIEMINNGGNNVELTIYREKYTNGNHHSITTTNIDNTIEVS